MPNKNYVNGRAFEYKIKKDLEKRGFFVVRTAGSHSPVDLFVFKRGDFEIDKCWALQLKSNCNPSRVDWVSFENLKLPLCFCKWFVVREGRKITWESVKNE